MRRKVKKYLITWNAGYGEFKEVVEASDEDDAEQVAYEMWLETAQSSADYSATELTSELAAEHGLDWDEEK